MMTWYGPAADAGLLEGVADSHPNVKVRLLGYSQGSGSVFAFMQHEGRNPAERAMFARAREVKTFEKSKLNGKMTACGSGESMLDPSRQDDNPNGQDRSQGYLHPGRYDPPEHAQRLEQDQRNGDNG